MNQIAEIDTATATALEEAEAAKLLALKRAKKKAMYKRAMAMREVLVERFPNIFCGFRLPKKPLKLKIHHDLLPLFPVEQS